MKTNLRLKVIRSFPVILFVIFTFINLSVGVTTVHADSQKQKHLKNTNDRKIYRDALAMINKGRKTFRYDTFGDELFWGDGIGLHLAIAGERFGGVGPGLSPIQALAVGLKVDVKALPRRLKKELRRGNVDLDDPATTLALLQLDAIVGITGFFDDSGNIKSVGIQCALCHSVVDNSFAPGIGQRLDGWANRDLNVGAIIGLAPNLQPFVDLLGVDLETVKAVLASWGPGKFDAELNIDGKAFRPDGGAAATLIPPAFGLAGVNLHTWTGWGGVSHWNAFVAVLEMGGQGTFIDSRLKDAEKFPIAAANGFDAIRPETDLVTKKLPDLHLYQLALKAPIPPKDSYDNAAADRGKTLFNGKAKCANCHVPPIYTEPGWNLHSPKEMGIDSFQADRSPEGGYRTSPLKGLWTHMKGGFFHDGRFPTLTSVIRHYDKIFKLKLSDQEVSDVSEFLKSI
ncbi:MAG: hypothetical protein V3V18_08515 [Methylococcales bacterium]